MVIAGAGGHGLEVRHVLIRQGIPASETYFFDEDKEVLERPEMIGSGIFEKSAIQKLFSQDPRFVLGVGNPIYREKLFHFLTSLGGSFYGIGSMTSFGSKNSSNAYDAMPYSFIGPGTKIGLGVLVNIRAHVHHECVVGDFSEIGPGTMMLGASRIGKKCRIGAGAILLPGVELGDGVIVGAGAVVTRNFGGYEVIKGIPARMVQVRKEG